MNASVDVDKRWFMSLLQVRKLSGRQFAHRLGLEPSAWSRVLSGQRKLSVDEVQRVARELQVRPEEVVERLGIELAPDGDKSIAVRYKALANGEVVWERGLGRVATPPGAQGGAEAARIAAQGASWMDGAVCVWNPSSEVGVEAVGRLAVYKVRGEEGLRLGILRPGARGKMTGTGLDGVGQDGLGVEWASRVVGVVL